MTILNVTLGQHLRALRKRSDLTLVQAATKLGTDAGTLSRIERDQRDPSLRQLRDLAALYGVRPATLLADPPAGAKPSKRRRPAAPSAAVRVVRGRPVDPPSKSP
jgi:transcriptional regulator with XRE-family HTH domain